MLSRFCESMRSESPRPCFRNGAKSLPAVAGMAPARARSYSTPLVDGVPLTRGSRATASFSARARPLKTASAMW